MVYGLPAWLAIVHEQQVKENREIVSKEVTREIHHHDVYPRIQPVITSEYLPAKHVLLDNSTGERKKLSQEEVDAGNYPSTGRVDEVVATSVGRGQY